MTLPAGVALGLAPRPLSTPVLVPVVAVVIVKVVVVGTVFTVKVPLYRASRVPPSPDSATVSPTDSECAVAVVTLMSFEPVVLVRELMTRAV
ncbi:unannotated protein [freshwater metagenome]|uniref:Unannotated protein n=1 Tax=freshwater metagenome TaxID=449393 RepID=A0A6J7KAK4_9ZZZZ